MQSFSECYRYELSKNVWYHFKVAPSYPVPIASRRIGEVAEKSYLLSKMSVRLKVAFAKMAFV